MSGANAISGIADRGRDRGGRTGRRRRFRPVLGIAAITMAMINVIGGFMVTDRMLVDVQEAVSR